MEEKITPEHRTIIIDGMRIHVQLAGFGQPLILIHGLGGPLMWQRVIEPLSRDFRVVVVDLPGFGESECLKEYYSTVQYAEFLIHFLNALNIERATLVGISYGAQIAAHVAHQHPDRVEKLVLISSTGLMTYTALMHITIFWVIFSFIAKHIVLKSKWLTCGIARLSFYDIKSRPKDLCDKYYAQLSLTGKRDALLNGMRNSITKDSTFCTKLSELRTPTLIVWGKQDRTVPSKYASRFQQCIPHSAVRILRDCAHSLPLEKPQELCDAIVQFIKSETV